MLKFRSAHDVGEFQLFTDHSLSLARDVIAGTGYLHEINGVKKAKELEH